MFRQSALRQYSPVVLLLLSGLAILPFPATTAAGERAKSRFYALCVGLRYPGTGKELRYTTSDVRAMAEAFTAASGYDELSSSIVCLVDDDPRQAKPTPQKVRQSLGRMAEDAGPDDRVVFYFSGHGLRSEDNRSILVCHAEDLDEERDGANVYLSEVRDILEQSRAGDKLMIIDACHSGGKSSGDGLTPDTMAKSLAGAGKSAGRDTVAWLASCDVSQQSWEDDESQQGLFTRFFLEAVGPQSALADTNFDGRLSLPELNTYISNAIGHYIHSRKMRRDRDWLTRSQSPRMGMGGTVSLSGEELRKVSLFYCPPDADEARPSNPEADEIVAEATSPSPAAERPKRRLAFKKIGTWKSDDGEESEAERYMRHVAAELQMSMTRHYITTSVMSSYKIKVLFDLDEDGEIIAVRAENEALEDSAVFYRAKEIVLDAGPFGIVPNDLMESGKNKNIPAVITSSTP